MHLSSWLSAALLSVALVAPATAAVTTYTDAAAFQSALTGGSFTETFTGVGDTPPADYGNGTFAFNASAAGGLYSATGDNLSTNRSDDALILTFTSGNVYGVGGNFFLTDIDGDFDNFFDVLIVLSTGDVYDLWPQSASEFVGFVSDDPIEWIAVVPYNPFALPQDGTGLYATVDNLTIGKVPEPASLALVGLGIAGLVARRRRVA